MVKSTYRRLWLLVALCGPAWGQAEPVRGRATGGEAAVTEALIHIPAGTFLRGSGEPSAGEPPPHPEPVAAFAIDKTEVTVAAYLACVRAGRCSAPKSDSPACNFGRTGRERHPINCVTWYQARDYCSFRDKRLPAEAEWEYAARGSDGRRYPWGSAEPARQLCWGPTSGDAGTCAVGSLAGDVSPAGVLDMAGNVSEWTADAVRGGAWSDHLAADVATDSRHAFDHALSAHDARPSRGFRCVLPAAVVHAPVKEAMIHIPAALIRPRSEGGERGKTAARKEPLAAFAIDQTEVTVLAYRECVRAGRCSPPSSAKSEAECNWGQLGRERHPVNCVGWQQAHDYCQYRGKRLPREAEWEYAARGHDERAYPWGPGEPDAQLCWRRGEPLGTCEVGHFPAGASPFGVLDMAGNVWEWTEDLYCDASLPGCPKLASHVVRGGAWNSVAPADVRVTARMGYAGQSAYAGFRCAGPPR